MLVQKAYFCHLKKPYNQGDYKRNFKWPLIRWLIDTLKTFVWLSSKKMCVFKSIETRSQLQIQEFIWVQTAHSVHCTHLIRQDLIQYTTIYTTIYTTYTYALRYIQCTEIYVKCRNSLAFGFTSQAHLKLKFLLSLGLYILKMLVLET